MACQSEENLKCPVCYEIFQDPVILSCSHSFCRACLQRWWTEKNLMCPVCQTKSEQSDPPQNLALRNLCEDFLKERAERSSTGSAALCSLHSEKLKLFCLDDQQPACVVCLHAETHKNHSFRPIDEAARDCRAELQELRKLHEERMELFNDIKGNFDKTEKDIEVQAQDAEKQIKDVFSMLQKFLEKEEQTRIAALKKEKEQKIQMMESKREALSDEFEGLYFSVNLTTQVLEYENLPFLHVYRTAADIAHGIQLNDPQPTPGALIDMDKHLNNLSLNILDRMRMEVTNTLVPQTAAPEPTVVSQPTRSPPSPGGVQDQQAGEIPILLASLDWRNIKINDFSDDETIFE